MTPRELDHNLRQIVRDSVDELSASNPKGVSFTADGPFPVLPTGPTATVFLGRQTSGFATYNARGSTAAGAWFAHATPVMVASVRAFEILSDELELHDAPSDLATRAERAARETMIHALAMGALARRYGGLPRPPMLTQPAGRTLEQMACENAIEGCVRETFGALVALVQAESAADPAVRDAMRAVARDEIRHAALAWEIDAWARTQLPAWALRRIDDAREEAFKALYAELANDPAPELIRALGLPSAARAEALLDGLCQLVCVAEPVLWLTERYGYAVESVEQIAPMCG